MKIEEHGREDRYRFTCKKCGCRYLAEQDEYSIHVGKWTDHHWESSVYAEFYVSANCPECYTMNSYSIDKRDIPYEHFDRNNSLVFKDLGKKGKNNENSLS